MSRYTLWAQNGRLKYTVPNTFTANDTEKLIEKLRHHKADLLHRLMTTQAEYILAINGTQASYTDDYDLALAIFDAILKHIGKLDEPQSVKLLRTSDDKLMRLAQFQRR